MMILKPASNPVVHRIDFVWNNGGGDNNAFTTGVILPPDQAERLESAIDAALGAYIPHLSVDPLPDVNPIGPGPEDGVRNLIEMFRQRGAPEDLIDGLQGIAAGATIASQDENLRGMLRLHEISFISGDGFHQFDARLTEPLATQLQEMLSQGVHGLTDVHVYQPTIVSQEPCEAVAEILEAAGAYCDLEGAKALWRMACDIQGVGYWLPDVPHDDNPVRGLDNYWAVDVVQDGVECEVLAFADEDAATEAFWEYEADEDGVEAVLKKQRRAVPVKGLEKALSDPAPEGMAPGGLS